jgi:hypothetical protein
MLSQGAAFTTLRLGDAHCEGGQRGCDAPVSSNPVAFVLKKLLELSWIILPNGLEAPQNNWIGVDTHTTQLAEQKRALTPACSRHRLALGC